ncbi:MAG TPA: SDR family oxidoreductase [Kofleriaceae bacterium]|nr:SDR family oxidoreductase [Kofleriaceae bacterium]
MSAHAGRTYAVTGATSGIGAATTAYLRAADAKVIACDLRDADVSSDLASEEGRRALVAGVTELCGGRLDGIVANAGGGPHHTMLQLNFFGATATLEGLRPLLAGSAAPRAVAVSSMSSLGPFDDGFVEACLAGDEAAVAASARDAIAAGKPPLVLYGSAKCALNRWVRAAACEARWAGAGIALNVVAPGMIDTPAAVQVLSNPTLREQVGQHIPLKSSYPGRPDHMASLLAWCVSEDNSLLVGQILFADAGFEAQTRLARERR